MCGINGFFGNVKGLGSEGIIKKMNQAIKHRGPDDSGFICHDNIALGHVRLSIIELSELGHQPMHSADGNLILVFNGELYNYQEIRESYLKEYPFKTNSDTEVILAAYQKFGNECFKMFNGMFALAVYNIHSGKLVVSRDRLGIKPVYYTVTDGVFCFSSEIKSILQTGFSNKKLHKTYLSQYLSYQTVYCPHTLVEDVKQLKPGHYLEMDKDLNIRDVEYWCFPKGSENRINAKTSELHKNIESLLIKSVERRLIADVPVSAFLSGGIDSSAIVALASKALGRSIDTYTVTFDESEFSEARYAQKIADLYNTNHHEIELKPKYLLDNLEEALDFMDHPSTDGPNTYIISKSIKQDGIKVALSGLGGDELFAGYSLFTRSIEMQKKLHWLKYVPNILRNLGANVIDGNSMARSKLSELIQEGNFQFESIYGINRRAFLNKDVQRLLKLSTSQIKPELLKSEYGELSSISQAEINTYMQNVLLRDTDQMSMAHALEVRVPFLDHELVEYVLRIGDEQKYPHRPKQLLVDALKSYLPDYIVNRPKMGFTLPWEHWMRNELKEFCETRIKSLSKREWIDSQKTLKLWEDFLNKKSLYSWSRLWSLVTLEHWIAKNGLQ
jgi:asparagine synthase (glutamine-hydrolysing)